MQMVSYPRPNPPLTVMTMLHGLVATGWLAIFYTQVRLVAAKRRDVHRQLGVWGMALGAAVIPIAYLTAMQAIPRGLHPPIIDAESWSAVPLLAVPAMALLLWMGWRNRIDPQAHRSAPIPDLRRLRRRCLSACPLSEPQWSERQGRDRDVRRS